MNNLFLAKAIARQLALRTLSSGGRTHGTVALDTAKFIIDQADRQLCEVSQLRMRTRFGATNQTYKRWMAGTVSMPWGHLLNAVKDAEPRVSGIAGATAYVTALEVAAQIAARTSKQIQSKFKSKRSRTKTWLQGWNANYPIDDKPCYDKWVPAPDAFDLDVEPPALFGTRVPPSEVNPDGAIWLPINGCNLVCGVWHDCIVGNKPVAVAIALRKLICDEAFVAEWCSAGPTTLDDVARRFIANGKSPTISPTYHRLHWWFSVDYEQTIPYRSYLTDQSGLPKTFHSKTAALGWYTDQIEQRPMPAAGSEGMYGTLLSA